jgi:NitT/TauT family transport system ATP-binding protein
VTAAIDVRDVSKVFVKRSKGETSGVIAVQEVNLEIPDGEFVCFIGPSGCGKTTVLNMIAGSILPTVGEIRCLGDRVTGLQTKIGYVTQEDTLLPWRTLEQNVSFGLQLGSVPKDEISHTVADYIRRAGLSKFENHYPHQLSGGMQKRATLIRTLVMNPRAILMDEPFGALDAQTRLNLQAQLLDLWMESRPTVVFVTHDVVEAISLADRIICFGKNPGHISNIIKVDLPRPRDVFHIHDTPGFNSIYDQVLAEVHDAER